LQLLFDPHEQNINECLHAPDPADLSGVIPEHWPMRELGVTEMVYVIKSVRRSGAGMWGTTYCRQPKLRIGCNSIALGATPVWPSRKSKKATRSRKRASRSDAREHGAICRGDRSCLSCAKRREAP
jgi:hypothetical protein